MSGSSVSLPSSLSNNLLFPVLMGCKSWKLCVILHILVASVRAQDPTIYHKCGITGNYASNSTYRANLNTLLSSLSSNIGDEGFYNASLGQNQDTVYTIVLCRVDLTPDQCRACVQNISVSLPERCPTQKQAIAWHTLCMLRYSSETMYGIRTIAPRVDLTNYEVSRRTNEFRETRTRLLDDIRIEAAIGGPGLKASAVDRNISDSQTLYALMQCTPDLSPMDCDRCLGQALDYMQSCCFISRGVRILMPSCNLRYELFSFFNGTRLGELQALLPPSPSPSPPGIASPPPPGTNDNNDAKGMNDSTKVVIGVVVPIGVCIIILAACAFICWRKRMKQRGQELLRSGESTTDVISNDESLQYDFGKIRAATNDFSEDNKLGQGGFGAVYRGRLLNGQDIAVKRLAKNSGQGDIEFKNEVLLVAKLQHKNLVRLLGFSMERMERALIYEFVQNASLDQFIFDPIKRSHMDWDKRYKIILGIARGLMYLHEDSRLKIIHRDLKASNVLLDGEMNPKIADFGMARLFEQDETHRNTSRIVGTYGYMAPEYAMHGHFSVKSDVFSFGVLVLEIISGQRNNYTLNGEEVEDLLTSTWKNWRQGTPENTIDLMLLRDGGGSMRDMSRCIHIGLMCVQENATDRPTTASIVLMLSSSTMTLAVPSEPAFYMNSRFGSDVARFQELYTEESSSSKTSNANAVISEGSTRNDMSVSELYPR